MKRFCLLFAFILLIFAAWYMYREFYYVKYFVKQNSVDSLPESFSDVSYLERGKFLVYEFKAKEEDFLRNYQKDGFKFMEITSPVFAKRYDYASADGYIGVKYLIDFEVRKGWFFYEQKRNGGYTMLAFDSSENMGFYVRIPR